MEWDNGVIIGISDGADFYDNFDPSSSAVACLNLPASNLSNVIYRLSEASPEVPPPGKSLFGSNHYLCYIYIIFL